MALSSRGFLRFALFFLAMASGVCAAQTPTLPPAVQQGLTWLNAEVQADGSLAHEATSTALPLQAREETLATLSEFEPSPATLAGAVAAPTDANVEFVARQVIGAAAAQQDTSAGVAALLALQNADGGWGLQADFQSDVLDSAFALRALAAAHTGASSAVANALGYLGQAKQADGSWGIDGQPSVYVVANVLLAADAWSSRYALASVTGAARDWLLAQRNANSAYTSVLDNALALRALATQTAQASTLQPISSALGQAQLADGSWADDPYQTALALDALWFVAQPAAPPTTGDVQGKVIDQSNAGAIAGATLQLVESGSSTTSAADGTFAFGGVAPGAYTLRLSMLGYQQKDVAIQVTAGQVLNLGSVALVPAPLTASVSGVIKNNSGQPLQNVTVSVGTASALTDASGAYQLAGLAPGAATISATLANYQTASASVTFVAGASYLFSPTLYPVNVPPPATSLQGSVIDATTKAAIVGASVVLNGVTKTTDASGKFSFTGVSAGAFTLTLSASGYQSVSASGTLVAGLNDVGKIALSAQPKTSTLTGSVTDADTQAAVAGATVAVQGQNLSATTDANGKYSIAGIVGTNFTLSVSASGYLTQSLSVALTQVGNGSLDVQLTKPTASGITFDAVGMNQPTYAPYAVAELQVHLANATGNAASLVVAAQVLDAQNNVAFEFQANAKGYGQNPPNLPVIVPAGGGLGIEMTQSMLRQAAGHYTVHAQAIDPTGRVVAEGDTQFDVGSDAILAGGLVPDPPLAQIGTNQPIALSADLTDVGNLPIGAGNLALQIVLQNADTQSSTAAQTSVRTFASGVPLNNPRSLVPDGKGGYYSVNYNDNKIVAIDATGLGSVFVTLPQSLGLPTLARDAQGNLWVGGSSTGKLFEVSPQGAISSITLTSLNSVSGLDVDGSGNLLASGSSGGEQRLLQRTPQALETVLWRNGLSTPEAMVKDDAGNYVVTNYGDNSLSKIAAASGAITPFASGLNRPFGIARDTQGNFYVADSGDNTVAKITAAGQVSTFASGLHQPYDLTFDAAGNLFVSNQADNSVVEILPDGSVQLYARGVANGPEGMKYDAAGNLWIANDDGVLRKKDPQDSVTVEATGLAAPRGIAVDASGAVLIANYSNGVLSKVSGGTTASFATGLSNPYGVALDGSGNVYVTEHGANRISAFDGSGNRLGTVQSMLYNPASATVGSGGEVYVRNYNTISVLEGGTPRVLLTNFSATYIAADPVHGGLVATTGYDVYHIALDGTSTHLNAVRLPFYTYGIGVAADGSAVVLDYSNRRLQKLDASGNLVAYADLPNYSQTLLTDLAGNVYVRLNTGVFDAIDASGNATAIPVTLSETIAGVGIAADGKILVWTYSDHVQAIDPASGTATLLFAVSGVGSYGSGIARDAAGNVYLSQSSLQELRTYSPSGTLSARLDGFLNPNDIVWTGSDFRFTDAGNRFYTMAPGGYPSKLGAFAANYLAVAGGDVYGTASSTGVIHWNGSAQETWKTVSGAYLNGGIAARADNALSAADVSASRVITFDTGRNIVANYVGIVRPAGLAFDAQGRLYVSNYGAGTIARFDAGQVPSLFAKDSAPTYLEFDGSGNLLVSRSGGVDKIDATGAVSTVSNALAVNGLLVDGTQTLALDGSNGQLRAFNGSAWNVVATGLSSPQGVRALGNGDLLVANHGNGTVVKYSGGQLIPLGSGLPGANVVNQFADGDIYVGGDSGLLYRIGADGSETSINVAKAVNGSAFYGIAPGTGGTFYGLASGNNLFAITITQATAPPPPGTVVYSANIPMSAMAAADGYTHFDLGAWLPPYGGDFRIDVGRSGVDGGATNFVHVGPAASGALTALAPSLPPGDQTEPMCLALNGADFTSISRVETSEVRPLVSSGQPNGMAADKAGNVYHTDSSALYKTTPQGTTSQIASGLSLRFGLAADSSENLYLTSRDASTGHYDLLRFDAAGNKTLVADLGSNATNGVQVNSRDEILVGSPNALLKVTQQGKVSVVTTAGLPQPRGIAVDGKDNVYVQNEGNYVSLIKPDGSVSDIFTRGDGVIDPQFEGDGYPNIAADCSDNFYIATSVWQKLGSNVQIGEEHTLAQVIARTGQISLLFDALKINPVLGDIDYLAFDRFGNRILMWNHNDGKVWQVPVTCGAISVDAHLVTPPGQTLDGMTVPQSATVPQADGSTEYVWSFRDVTASGQQVCFDTTLHGLALGETRQTLASAYITFQNSFAANDVKEAVDVPSVHVDNLLQLGVATDQAEYPANATAQVTTTLTNPNAQAVTGTLGVNVYDAGGVLVGSVTQQDVSVPAGGGLPVTNPFAIGTILPAQYTVRALLSDNGLAVASATSVFDVLPDNVNASATSFVHTDKPSYNANDHVTIASRAQSLSSNLILSNLTLMVQVYDPSGALQFSHGYSIAQLLPGALRDFSVADALSTAPPGIYTVKQDLLDDQNRTFNHVETAFAVNSSSDTGFGLSGTIAAAPKSVTIGSAVALSASATNQGNSALDNVPLHISIVDPNQAAVLQKFDQTVALAQGASAPFDASWITQGQAGATYFAVLTADVGSGATAKTLTLAVDTFTLSAPAFHLDASVSLNATPAPLAALVLIDANASAAETARITGALTALGYAATFASTPGDFAAGVRSGAYRVYLLLATQVAPDSTTLRLLREAVHRGDGLLAANGAAALPAELAQITGLQADPALPPINAQALDVLASAPGGSAHLAFSPPLPARIVVSQSGQTEATFTGRLPATPDTGTLAAVVAADGRADLGYFGSDVGTNGSHLALSSAGRIRDAGGHDLFSVWLIRNSGDNARNVILASVAGGYSYAATITSHTDTYLASPIVAGTADHVLSENGQTIQRVAAASSAFTDTRVVDSGDNPGAIALWANAIDTSGALQWSGAQHELHGAIHSNSNINLAGAQNLIDGPVHYVTGFSNAGSQNTFTVQPRQVAAAPLPTLANLDDFRPGGAVAMAVGAQYFDATAECAAKHSWQRTTKQLPLASGVYWIPCDAQISGASAGGTATLVGTGSIHISGSNAKFDPFYQGMQFATSASGAAAIQLSGSSATLGGLVLAPHGTVQLSGSSMKLACSVIADQIQLAGAKTVIDARNCAYATVQRTAPALLANAFGAGKAGYAAFDWQAAIGQYDANGTGGLSQLFGGVLGTLAPSSNPLRAGSIVPLAATVTNKADAFTGTLQIGANDDSTFVPPTVSWALDFSKQATFQAQSNVRLGAGASTTLNASVASAAPLAIDPLAQTSVTLTHLAGDTVADLIAALNATANRDGALDAAVADLEAAQSVSGDAALLHLLDAAEACGASSNAAADGLRTRIDWLIWASTH